MEQGTLTAERTGYFDFLRVVATYAVIILHIAAQNWYKADVGSLEWKAFNAYDSIVRWGVPIFVMISGALFLNGQQALERIFKKNIFRIITAFCFWSCVYTAADYLEGVEIPRISLHFLRGHYHMWFLFMIVGLYLIIPFLRKIVESDFLGKYFLVLALAFSFVLPQFLSLLPYASERAGAVANAIVKDLDFHFTLGYAAYFVLGFYLDRCTISRKAEGAVYVLGMGGFAATVLCSQIISNHQQKGSTLFYGNFTVNVLLESIAVFVFFRKHCQLANVPGWVKSLIQRLAKYSFGVYLAHALVIEQMSRRMGWDTLSYHPLLSVPLNGVVVFLASFGISAILNHVPVLRRYIV
ncbi:MAG: acyltransferase family protein [Lachnospiraceae bacterium]|jgi:surface polysaccharide O-acyltransferase-like enzyme|nr:acyltransferase family protein [Lachnospiraceae bacterium]